MDGKRAVLGPEHRRQPSFKLLPCLIGQIWRDQHVVRPTPRTPERAAWTHGFMGRARYQLDPVGPALMLEGEERWRM